MDTHRNQKKGVATWQRKHRSGFTSGVRKHTTNSAAGGQLSRKQIHPVPAKAGFTLLLSVLVASIVLAIGLAILNITMKEFQLSNLARESERAMYAANAGMECALYWDRSSQGNKFDVGTSNNITCMGDTDGNTALGSGETHVQTFSWGGANPVCAEISVTKYIGPDAPAGRNCPAGVECTIVESRGYNKTCDTINTPGTVERALRALY